MGVNYLLILCRVVAVRIVRQRSLALAYERESPAGTAICSLLAPEMYGQPALVDLCCCFAGASAGFPRLWWADRHGGCPPHLNPGPGLPSACSLSRPRWGPVARRLAAALAPL